jgi:Ca2+-binding RTX toxin-like protein
MFGAELALLGNALMMLFAMSFQFDVFGDDDETAPDDTSAEDFVPSLALLFDESDFGNAITGTEGSDLITSELSDPATSYDLLAGDDTLNSTENSDFVQGGDGADFMVLFSGDDIAIGGAGDDQIFAGRGNDSVDGGEGNDRIDGSLGDDTLYGNAGDDQITGGKGTDFVFGGAGDDTLSGSRLDEFGLGSDGIDRVDGGSGNDIIWLSGGDFGTGGSGEDLFVVYDTEEEDNVVTVTDYNQDQDSIELIYQDEDGVPAPEVTVAYSEETNDASVALDGITVLRVSGAAELTASEINLIPESA